jgi:hypothetical protein
MVTFEIGVILDDLLDAHPSHQQLQEVLDGVAQLSHRGLAVTERRVSDSVIRVIYRT